MTEININELIAKAETIFSHVGILDVDTIIVHPSVREYCEENKCHQYDKKWTCPPGAGTLEECEARIRKYHRGLILQTTGELEDSLDFEMMGEISKNHMEHMIEFSKYFRKEVPSGMIVGDMPCVECKECTYPHEPCRFPDKISYSMSALGMIVSEVCRDNNINYYYGPGTLTYVGCVFID